MTGSEFLKNIRDNVIEVRHLREQLERERSKYYPGAMKIKPVMVQESPPTDRMAEIAANVSQVETEIRKRIETLESDIAYAHSVIARMENGRHRQVLTLYYLSTLEVREIAGKNDVKITRYRNYSWADVADEMGLASGNVWRHARAALDEFEELADL